MSVLSVSGLVAGYSAADEILKQVGFELQAGEIACIIGPNGAGKSTLLKAIAGLVKSSKGSVVLNGEPINGRAPREITRLGLAYVPQEHNVFPSMTIVENLEMGGYVEPGRIAARMDNVMQRFPVLQRKRSQAARTLSGGERQILAMGMALMVEPKVLLLDEPSAGLSPVAAHRLFEDIRAINREGVAIALVEQNASDALDISDRAYILVDGRNHRTGIASDIANDAEIRRVFLGG
ncbi:ABC transporter ATP-binding protein [Bosea sp. BK604]|uniref:ABC transporter ATP-binding protein n=1 Tax=Bosea sp. BK604 TaxID=2512180 RepID=UPI001049EC91|nr:ABC transporter ATP-binding protein [Bosea sp. BK604]TCR64203.1 branched-chain amino acid transport system ATP-binding protein/neutral amino acid transport system ATP-binding protein [Bosea sp. BK604]